MRLRVACVQSALAWEDRAANLDHFAAEIGKLAEAVDLFVLPEMFTTGFSMQPERVAEPEATDTQSWLQQRAREANAAIVGSVATESDGRFVNRLLWATPDGRIAHYDKRHLFRMGREDQHYAAGTRTLVVEWGGFRIAPLICYDLRFPVWSRRRASYNYDLLLYVANWPAARRYPWQQLLRARAIENQAFVAGCNRVGADGNGVAHAGDSVILDAMGQPLAELAETPGVVQAELDLQSLRDFRERFPAHLDADRFTLES